jgi:UDPglucose--hexose-1-phosphate uridylyltransferase
VPDNYQVHLYPNDFPAFSPASSATLPEGDLFVTAAAPGACDVILYSPNHKLLPSELSVDQWQKVIDLWTRRTAELNSQSAVRYVSIFENAGVAIGVTMPHPHGQIYGYPFVPPLVQTELDAASTYMRDHGACLYCRILEGEIRDERRVVASNDGFAAFLPFFGRFPNELQIYSRRHLQQLTDLSEGERRQFASLLKTVRQKFDHLYGFPMPLMMLIRQPPAAGDHPYFHFHVDFLPIQRSATKLKYLAAVESGCGAFLNDTRAEEQAELLRNAEPAT